MSSRSRHQTHRRRGTYRYLQRGTTYILHFYDPGTGKPARYYHAGHYTGWEFSGLAARVAQHRNGTGNKLVKAALDSGLEERVAWIWRDTTKDQEDYIKCRGGAARNCPDCGATPEGGQPYEEDGMD